MFESFYEAQKLYCYENLKDADKKIANAYLDAIEEVECTDYEIEGPKTLKKIAMEIAADYKKEILAVLEFRLDEFYRYCIDGYEEDGRI